MTKTDARKQSRFKVNSLNTLEGSIDRGRTAEKLATLGFGGCGFYGLESSVKLTVGRRVYCSFKMEGIQETPIEIQGNIIYAKEVETHGKTIIFYDIEFIESQKGLIEPIAIYLQSLQDSGAIQNA